MSCLSTPRLGGDISVEPGNGKTHQYIYAGGKLLRETISEGSTTTTLDFAYDNVGMPYSLIYNNGTTTTTYYYITNLQGDVMYLVDASGNEAAAYDYDPYGKIIFSATGELAEINPLRYRGYYYDTETGFYYLQSRYYDPEICRFINADSYASTGQGLFGYNMFSYCINDPIRNIDSAGCMAVEAAVTATNWWNPAGWVAAAILVVEVVVLVVTVCVAANETAEAIKDRVAVTEDIQDRRDQSVYVLTDPADGNQVKYVGRTNNPARRAREHKNSKSPKSGYEMTVVATGLTVPEAQKAEQALISAYTLKYLDNARREIAVGNLQKFKKNIISVVELFRGLTEDELMNLMGR